jgi:hypothetical protein
MRKIVFTALVLPAAVAALYACTGDSSSPGTTPDASAPVPTPTTPPPPPPPSPDAPPPFTPDALGSKLVLWLAADGSYSLVDGGVVWKDKSDAGNDAVQDDPAHQPGYLDGGTDGSVAGNGVVHFDGTSWLQIADSVSLEWATSDFGLYAVVRHTNVAPSYAIVYSKWTDTPPYPGIFLWANYPYGPTHTGPAETGYITRLDTDHELFSDGGLNDDQMRVVGIRKTGDHFELRVAGQLAADTPDAGGYDAAAFDAVGRPVYLGGRPQLVQMLQGDIAEIAGLKGTVSDKEQSDLEAYLKSKYGL